MTEKKKTTRTGKKQTIIPKKPRPVSPVGGGQGGFLTGPGTSLGIGNG
jgi:hypothetical protein